jgi:hypothetical protein
MGSTNLQQHIQLIEKQLHAIEEDASVQQLADILQWITRHRQKPFILRLTIMPPGMDRHVVKAVQARRDKLAKHRDNSDHAMEQVTESPELVMHMLESSASYLWMAVPIGIAVDTTSSSASCASLHLLYAW